MAWKFDSWPSGFYVREGDKNIRADIIYFSGTRKGNKYCPSSDGFTALQWNCLPMADWPYAYCATVNDVKTEFADNPEILARIATW